MGKKIILTESKLRQIVENCARRILQEGYSSKRHQNEIVGYAREIYESIVVQGLPRWSKDVDIPWSTVQGYAKRITINAQKGDNEDAGVRGNVLSIIVTPNTSLNRVAQLLMHEFTHVYDSEIENKTGYNMKAYKMYYASNADIPESMREIVYHLWIPSEFNAFQTTYDFNDGSFNEMIERFMDYAREAYEYPTTSGVWPNDYKSKWQDLQQQMGDCIPSRYRYCNVEAFKRFFVKHTLYLINKLVKKWDGKQNTKFVNENRQDESWKGLATAGMLGLSALAGGGNNQAQAQTRDIPKGSPTEWNIKKTPYNHVRQIKYDDEESRNEVLSNFMQSYQRQDDITNNPYTVNQLKKMFPKIYNDRNNPEVWEKNYNLYLNELENFNMRIPWRTYLSYKGKFFNPWRAVLSVLSRQNYNNKQIQSLKDGTFEQVPENDNLFTLEDFDL